MPHRFDFTIHVAFILKYIRPVALTKQAMPVQNSLWLQNRHRRTNQAMPAKQPSALTKPPMALTKQPVAVSWGYS